MQLDVLAEKIKDESNPCQFFTSRYPAFIVLHLTRKPSGGNKVVLCPTVSALYTCWVRPL